MIGLVEDGDTVVLDVATRTLEIQIADEMLAERRAKMEANDGHGSRGIATAR